MRGTEIKSIRAGHANLNDAFARVDNGRGVSPQRRHPALRTRQPQHPAYVPKRERKLLLHKQEIDKLYGLAAVKGHALVALRMYWKNGKVKIEIGVGKGKVAHDKRQDLKERATRRETDREVARFNRRHG